MDMEFDAGGSRGELAAEVVGNELDEALISVAFFAAEPEVDVAYSEPEVSEISCCGGEEVEGEHAVGSPGYGVEHDADAGGLQSSGESVGGIVELSASLDEILVGDFFRF